MAYFNLQMFAADGHLNFDTKVDSAGFSDGMKSLGSIAKGGLAVLGASVAGVTGLFVGMSKAALGSVASLEQNVGGVETLFKDSAQTVIDNANNAYKTAGLSANEYMSSVTSFSASLLQSVAGDTAEAARVADMAMVDMSDNANKMGTDMGSIQNAYQGFAKQNYTMLDNLKLGYGGTKEEMQRLLADASKISGTKYDIGNLDDVYSAIHTIQGELDITGTTAKEASTTIEGSMNAAKAAYDNFLNGSGSAKELADAVSTVINNVAKNLGEIVPRLAETVPMVIETLGEEFAGSADQFIQVGTDLLTDIATGIVEGLPAFIELAVSFIDTIIQNLNDNMPQLLEAGATLIVSLAEGVMTLIPSLLSLGWSIIQGIVSGIMENSGEIRTSGEGILTALSTGISTTIPQLVKQGFEAIGKFVDGLLENLPSVLSAAGDILTRLVHAILEALPKLLDSGMKLIGQMAQGILKNLPAIVTSIAGVIIELLATITSHLPEILQKGIELIGELAAGLIQAIPVLVGKIPEIIAKVKDKFLEFDWIQIGVDIVKGIANGLKNAVGLIIDSAKSVGQAALDGLKNLLAIHSPSRVFRDEVGKNIALGVAEGIVRNKEHAKKSAEELAQLTLDAAKKKLDNHKVYNHLSLADEVAYWDSIRKQVKEGTQARIDADKEYLNAKENMDGQLLKLDQDYADKTATSYKDLNDRIQSLNEQYQNSVNQRADQIASSFGLFDEFDVSTDMTADDLLNNLQGQVDGLNQWQSNLKKLDRRGISDELLAELQEMGPKAAAEIQLMTEMSEAQLDEYAKLFGQKNRIARKQAVSEMEPMREEISGQIAQMQRDTASELAKYQQEYVIAMSELGVAMNQPLETMKMTAAQNAIALVTTMADTLKEAAGSGENTDKFKEIAQSVLGATDTLPASMAAVGQNAIASMIEGIKSMSGSLYEAVAQVVGNAVNGALDSVLSGKIIDEALSGINSVTGSTAMPAQAYGNEGYGPGYEMNYKRLGKEVAGAIGGMSVMMDGNKVGTVVAGPVNEVLGSQGQVKERDG